MFTGVSTTVILRELTNLKQNNFTTEAILFQGQSFLAFKSISEFFFFLKKVLSFFTKYCYHVIVIIQQYDAFETVQKVWHRKF